MLWTAPPPARECHRVLLRLPRFGGAKHHASDTTIGLDIAKSIRAHLTEFGIVAPVGRHAVEQLLGIAADANDKRLPEVARACVAALGAQLRMLKERILQFDRMITAWHQPAARRYTGRWSCIGHGSGCQHCRSEGVPIRKGLLGLDRARAEAELDIPLRKCSIQEPPGTYARVPMRRYYPTEMRHSGTTGTYSVGLCGGITLRK
jgi:hypothetical protein